MSGESPGKLLREVVAAEPYGEGDAEADQGSSREVEVWGWDVLPDGTARDLVRGELVVHHGYDAEILGGYACAVGGETGKFGECLDGMFDRAVDECLCASYE